MSGSCRCGEICRRCGGCKAQHYKKENRDYLGCDGFLPCNRPTEGSS